jgi:hypothetical protein
MCKMLGHRRRRKGLTLTAWAHSVYNILQMHQSTLTLPTVQKMIDSLVINKSLGTGIEPMLDNSTNLYPDNLEKCYDGLCYVMWTRHC